MENYSKRMLYPNYCTFYFSVQFLLRASKQYACGLPSAFLQQRSLGLAGALLLLLY